MKEKIWKVVFGLLAIVLFIFLATREPKKPGLPKWQMQEQMLKQATAKAQGQAKRDADAALVKMLLKEDLSGRSFDFPVVAHAVSGKKVIPLREMKSTERLMRSIRRAVQVTIAEMNEPESPIKGLRRINEGSRYFEDRLQQLLDAEEGLRCEFPKTRDGSSQRSGYPDLMLTEELTGEVFYLDPKLMEQGSVKSSLRTFYFEPKDQTLKITEDAAHLLIGIEHDGRDGDWKFTGYRLVDLSSLKVRLKAEFQASNKDLYSERSVLETGAAAGKDVAR